MGGKALGVALGVLGMTLWFMPLIEVGFNVYAAGKHVGIIGYFALFCFLAYTIFSVFELHKLRVVVASIAMGISLLSLVVAWDNAAWGLYAISAVSVLSWIAACSGWGATKDTGSQLG